MPNDGFVLYNVGKDLYRVADKDVKAFESENPDASIKYSTDDYDFDIPLSQREEFLKDVPNATFSQYDDKQWQKSKGRDWAPSKYAGLSYDELLKIRDDQRLDAEPFISEYEEKAKKSLHWRGSSVPADAKWLTENRARYDAAKADVTDLARSIKAAPEYKAVREGATDAIKAQRQIIDTAEEEVYQDAQRAFDAQRANMTTKDRIVKAFGSGSNEADPFGEYDPNTYRGWINTEGYEGFGSNIDNYEAAKNILSNAEKTLKSVTKTDVKAAGDKKLDVIMKGVGQGIGHNVSDLDSWSAILGAKHALPVYALQQKLDTIFRGMGEDITLEEMDKRISDGLTPSEQALFYAIETAGGISEALDKEIHGSVKAGESMAMSARMGLEFLLLSGMSGAANATVARNIEKRLARKLITKETPKAARKVISSLIKVGAEDTGALVGGGIQTALGPSNWAQVAKNIQNNYQQFIASNSFTSLMDPEVRAANGIDTPTLGGLTLEGLVQQLIGNSTELGFGPTNKAIRYLQRAGYKGFSKLGWNHIASLLTPQAAATLKKMGINPLREEFGEEVNEALISWVRGTERDDEGRNVALKNFFDAENLAILFASFVPTIGFGSVVSAAQRGAANVRFDEARTAYRNYLISNGVAEDKATNIVDSLNGATPEELGRRAARLLDNARTSSAPGKETEAGLILNLLEAARDKSALDGVASIKRNADRDNTFDEILGNTNKQFWQTREEDAEDEFGNQYKEDVQFVDVLTTNGENNFFIRKEDENGNVETIDENGTIRRFTAAEVEQGLADGTFTGRRQMDMADYLDERNGVKEDAVWEVSAERTSQMAAYDAGNQTGQNHNAMQESAYDIAQNLESARLAAIEAGVPEDDLRLGSDVLARQAFDERQAGNTELATALDNYATAKAAYDGLKEGYIASRVQRGRNEAESYIKAFGRNDRIISGMYTDARGEMHEGYILSEDVAIARDGSVTVIGGTGDSMVQVSDGKGGVVLIPASQLSAYSTTFDEYRNEFDAASRQWAENAFAEAESRPSRTAMSNDIAPLVGRTILVNGQDGAVGSMTIVSVNTDAGTVTFKDKSGGGAQNTISIDTLYGMAQRDAEGHIVLDPTATENKPIIEAAQQQAEASASEEAETPQAPQLRVGDEVSVVFEGQPANAMVTGIDNDGSITFSILNEAGEDVRAGRVSGQEFANMMNAASTPAPAAPAQSPTPAPAPAPEPAPAATRLTPEQEYENVFSDDNFETEDEAYGFVKGKVKRAKEAADKAQAAVDKIKPEDFDTSQAYRTAKDKAKKDAEPAIADYEHWKAVKDLADAGRQSEKERQERLARMEERALMEPHGMREVVANAFSANHSLDREDFKRETGLSDAELRRFFPFWAKKGTGMTVKAFAESIAANDDTGLLPRDGETGAVDINAIRSEIIDLILNSQSPRDIMDYTRNENIRRREEAERYAEGAPEDLPMTPEEAEAEKQQPFIDRIREWEQRTGVRVNAISQEQDVTEQQAREAIQQGRKITGWFNKFNGSVEIYLPNITSISEIDATFMHEVISHKGLRELFKEVDADGNVSYEKYNRLLDAVWNDIMTEADRQKYIDYVNRGGEQFENEDARRRAAADEYIAYFSETLNPDVNPTGWEKFVELVKSLLDSMGFKITKEDLSRILYSSLANFEKNRFEEQPVRESTGNGSDFAAPFDEDALGFREAISIQNAEKEADVVEIKSADAPTRKDEVISMLPPKGGVLYPNRDQNRDIRVTRKSIRHSLDHADLYKIQAASRVKDIVGNAVMLGELPIDKDEVGKTSSVSVFYCPVRIDGSLYSARLVVKQYIDNQGAVLDNLSLYDMNMHNKKTAPSVSNVADDSGVYIDETASAYKVKDLIYKSQEEDQKLAGVENPSALMFREANENQEIFVSNAAKALEGISQDKATPEQWLKMIESKGGLKAGEDKWIGLTDWIKSRRRKTLTKQEIEDYINEHKIQIEEVHYGDIEDSGKFRSLQKEYSDKLASAQEEIDKIESELQSFWDEMQEKYGEDWEYSMTGGENWRETQLVEQRNKWEENPEEAAFDAMVDKYGDDFRLAFTVAGGTLQSSNDEAASYYTDVNPINSIRRDYTTEGLENKREIALTVPTIEPYNQIDDIHFGDAGGGRAVAWIRFGDATTTGTMTDEEKDFAREALARPEEYEASKNANGRTVYFPFGDKMEHNFILEREGYFIPFYEEKMLEGVRGFYSLEEAVNALNEKILSEMYQHPQTRYVLFIDEIQSKRHQDGREKGYWSDVPEYEMPVIPEDLVITEDETQYHTSHYGNDYSVGKGVTPTEAEAREYLASYINEGIQYRNRQWAERKYNSVPNAPFEKNWHELAMKRMLRLAAEEGYDYVAWTTGDQQAERYDIGQVVESISYEEPRKVWIDNAPSRHFVIRQQNGSDIPGRVFVEGEYKGIVQETGENSFGGKRLSDVLGKALAEQIINAEGEGDISGDGLRMGAEGMSGFYDQILPRFMDKYGKKWGVKTEDITLPDVEEAARTAHAIRVTPEMKESVKEGQLMFREKDAEFAEAEKAGDTEAARRLLDAAAKDSGYTVRAYHGTARADRVGNVFRPERATSGPMAFFTESRTLAEGYARGKQDTSIAYDSDYDTYETQFRTKRNNGKDYSVYDVWRYLLLSERMKIAEKAKHIRLNLEGDGEVIYDPNATQANGGWDYQVRDNRGDILRALDTQWLASGNLFGRENDYLKVLEMAGVNEALEKSGFEAPRYMDPEYREEAVYDVYLKIQKPFDVETKVNEKFISDFEKFAQEHEGEYTTESAGADSWDKNSISAEEFADNLRSDLKNGTTFAWTSIPDVVTAFLKEQGYDGIKDKGGKFGGEEHVVWVPFYSEQIKSAEPFTYDDEGNLIPLSERFNENRNDIRFRESSVARNADGEFEAIRAKLDEVELDATHKMLDSMESEFGIKINRVSRNEMPKGHETDKGYYDTATGEVTICMDNVANMDDAMATVLHESVGHLGLRRLLGSRFNDAMRDIYNRLDREGKNWVNRYIASHDLKPGDPGIIEGVEEYLSHLAESGDFKNSVWDEIKQIICDVIDAIFGTDGFTLTDNELNYILRASYENLKDPNWLNTLEGQAKDIALKYQLGINETDPSRPTDPDGGIRFRESSGVARDDFEQDMRGWWNNTVTEHQNKYLPVQLAVKRVMEEVGKKELNEAEDFEAMAVLSSSRAQTEQQEFEMFFFSPILDQVRKIRDRIAGKRASKTERTTAYHEVLDYLYRVSGLERNEYKNNEIEQAKIEAVNNLRADAQARKDAIDNDANLSDAEKAAQKDAIDAEVSTRIPEIEAEYESRKKDWSGLSSLEEEVDQKALDNLRPLPTDTPKEISRKQAQEADLRRQWWQNAEAKARAAVDDFRSRVGDDAMLTELWDNIRKATDYNLKHALDHGLLTQEEYDRLHGTDTTPRMWNYYLPLRGFAEETAEDVYDYSSFTSSPANGVVVKKMGGRWTEADNPLANILNIAETEIAQGNANMAKQALYRFALNAGENTLLSVRDAWYVKDPTTGKWTVAEVQINPATGKEETLEEFEARMEGLRKSKDQDGKPLARKGRRGLKLDHILRNSGHKGEHIIRLKVAGQEKVIWVNGNPAVAQAVNGVQRAKAWGWLRNASRALSNLFTTYSLDFTARNLIRDTMYSRMGLMVKENRAYRQQYRKNWWNNFGYGAFAFPMVRMMAQWESGRLQQKANPSRKEQMFMDFMRDGGATGYTIINSVDTIKRDLERAMRRSGEKGRKIRIPILGHYAAAVKTLNEGFELLTRFTAYQTSRQMGRSGQRSALDAKEISVNFNRQGAQSGKGGFMGALAAYMGATHYFYNAGVQGFDNFLRLFKAAPVKMTGSMAGLSLLGMMTPIINSAIAGLVSGLGGDDDDDRRDQWYWELPQWVRRNNIVLGWPGFYATIPLPPEFRAFYGLGDIAASFMYDKVTGNNGFAVAGDILNTAAGVLPVNPIENFNSNGNVGVPEGVLRTFFPDAGMFIVDLATNRDFTGKPLAKENPYYDTTPASQAVYASDPEYLVKATQWLAQQTAGTPVYVDLNAGKLRDIFKNFGGGFYNTAEDVAKIFMADEKHPLRRDNIPFFSGFTGHLDEDRANNFENSALREYKDVSEKVVRRISSAIGDKVSPSDVYNNPENLPQEGRVQALLEGKDYQLGKMYHDGMNNRKEIIPGGAVYKSGKKKGQPKPETIPGVNKLRQGWKDMQDAYFAMPEGDEKEAFKLQVQDAFNKYHDAEGNLCDRLLEYENENAFMRLHWDKAQRRVYEDMKSLVR